MMNARNTGINQIIVVLDNALYDFERYIIDVLLCIFIFMIFIMIRYLSIFIFINIKYILS
jgi:hypothetical protein